MDLTQSQQELLKKLVVNGKNLSEIQAALQTAGAQMTYMELRFLVDDLGLALKEKPVQKTIPPMTKPSAADTEQQKGITESTAAVGTEAEGMTSAGGVAVTIDALVRPGTTISGEVTFGDGIKVQWALDGQGRLGLYGAPKGYQPTQLDVEDFQLRLRELLEKRGI